MKKLSFLTLFLLMLLHSASGQDDLQWIIENGIGKQGVNGSQNFFPTATANPIGNMFQLNGISFPQYTTARNDLFLIYSDSAYFNSRYHQNLGSFYEFNANYISGANPTFQINNSTNTPLYGYLSNVYEGDDPPDLVFVNNFRLRNSTDFSALVTTHSQTLSANHNVVAGKDITLIVDLKRLPQNDPGSTNFVPPYYLTFNKIKNLANSNYSIQDTFFEIMPVFNIPGTSYSQPGFPNKSFSYTPQKGKIQLHQDSSRYLFFNLRPSEALDTCYPANNSSARYEANFIIEDSQGNQIAMLPELLLNAHDPNFLRVDSICRDITTGEQIIYYHLQFKNTGALPANNLSASIWLPNTLRGECFEVTEWVAGGNQVSGTFSNFMNIYFLNFDSSVSLNNCQKSGSTTCIGYIKFKVKTGGGVNIRNVNVSLKPTMMSVGFGKDTYPINKFIDKINNKPKIEKFSVTVDSYRPILNNQCGYTCRPLQSPKDELEKLNKHIKRNAPNLKVQPIILLPR